MGLYIRAKVDAQGQGEKQTPLPTDDRIKLKRLEEDTGCQQRAVGQPITERREKINKEKGEGGIFGRPPGLGKRAKHHIKSVGSYADDRFFRM